MKRLEKLKKNKDFQHVFNKGRSTANRQFVIYVLKCPGREYSRIGLSVSKKIGNAVTRNRIKRHVREVLRHLEDKLEMGNDYIIIARKPTAAMSYQESLGSLKHVLKRAKVLKR
ncbi:ribonuclease P protein component [Scopulibacillus darangshiensis]|uniref:Ribonuclease P protein component n=1 Tax=Scopulibacillus darangshiensis TaxID=442528 RepID=A0A4R2NF96_9BACL|nr:ribonuclease P protein component [Scopulibacillus darangshiensis]TCP20009.1 ribonuclease P protein component [Scopulibacillus darangshiensis]